MLDSFGLGLLAGISCASLDFLLGYIEVFSFGLVGAISSLIWAASGPFIWAFLGLFLGLAGRFLGFFGPAGGGFFGFFSGPLYLDGFAGNSGLLWAFFWAFGPVFVEFSGSLFLAFL